MKFWSIFYWILVIVKYLSLQRGSWKICKCLCNKALWTRVNFSRTSSTKNIEKIYQIFGKTYQIYQNNWLTLGRKRPKPDGNVTDSFSPHWSKGVQTFERGYVSMMFVVPQPVRVDTLNLYQIMLKIWNCTTVTCLTSSLERRIFTHLLNRTKISKLSF